MFSNTIGLPEIDHQDVLDAGSMAGRDGGRGCVVESIYYIKDEITFRSPKRKGFHWFHRVLLYALCHSLEQNEASTAIAWTEKIIFV